MSESFSRQDGRLFAEGVAVEDIAAAAGTPVYVYSGGALAFAYDALDRAFDACWIGDHCDACGLRDICPDPVR